MPAPTIAEFKLSHPELIPACATDVLAWEARIPAIFDLAECLFPCWIEHEKYGPKIYDLYAAHTLYSQDNIDGRGAHGGRKQMWKEGDVQVQYTNQGVNASIYDSTGYGTQLNELLRMLKIAGFGQIVICPTGRRVKDYRKDFERGFGGK